jgi:hypothetical protein
MTFTVPSPRRASAGVLSAVVALLIAGAAPAAAAPVTYTQGVASVTLDSDTYAAGTRVTLSGTGFASGGGPGRPWVAIKPDDRDTWDFTSQWAYGGPSARPVYDVGGGEWTLIFEAAADGTFSGWIDIPASFPALGPAVAPRAGQHWFRVLCGLLSSDGSQSSACGTPIFMEAYFSVTAAPGQAGAPTPGTPGAGGGPSGSGPITNAARTPLRVSAAKLADKGRKLRVTLGAGTSSRVRVTVQSATTVRVGGKGTRAKTLSVTRARTVTLAAGKVVNLELTADARKALKQLGSLKAVVRMAPVGGGTVITKTVTLKP